MNDDGKLTQFTLGSELVPVRFIETMTVKEGVECDVYVFSNDASKDLAIVRVAKGYKTPLQRILLGTETIEGFLEGNGTLTVRSINGKVSTNKFAANDTGNEVIVAIGEVMQWEASGDNELVFYEICEPPYVDGRFENLTEKDTVNGK